MRQTTNLERRGIGGANLPLPRRTKHRPQSLIALRVPPPVDAKGREAGGLYDDIGDDLKGRRHDLRVGLRESC